MADLERLATAAEARLRRGDRAGGLRALGELGEALEDAGSAVRNAWAARLGELAIRARRYGEAEALLREALPEARAERARLALLLRRALQAQGRHREAREFAARFLHELESEGPEAVLERFAELRDPGEPAEAEAPDALLAPEVRADLESFAELVHDPAPTRDAGLAELLARAEACRERWEDPLHALALAFTLLAEATRLPLGQGSAWLALARQALDATPPRPLDDSLAGQMAWIEGSLRAALGEVEVACACLEEADRRLPEGEGLRADPGSELMLVTQLADCLLEVGRAEDAERLFRHALDVVPEGERPVVVFQAHHGLGRLCHSQERLAEAYRHMRRALRFFDYAEPPWIGRATRGDTPDYEQLRELREGIEAAIEDCKARLPEQISEAFESPGQAFRPG